MTEHYVITDSVRGVLIPDLDRCQACGRMVTVRGPDTNTPGLIAWHLDLTTGRLCPGADQEPARPTLERCVCGQCFDCPDGWHHEDDLPCGCTPDCALTDDEEPCPLDPDGQHFAGCGC